MIENEMKLMQQNFYDIGFNSCVVKVFKLLEGKIKEEELIRVISNLLYTR